MSVGRETDILGRKQRLQAAMEYLMTYGWAILVIAVVLGVLYYFGVFSGPSIGNSCLAAGGYLCSNPILNSSGYLSIGIAIDGNPITITGINCTQSSNQPSSYQPLTPIELQTGNVGTVQIFCQGAAGPIGHKYTGYIWINYSTSTQSNLYAKIAAIDTVVSSVFQLPAGSIISTCNALSGTNTTIETGYATLNAGRTTNVLYSMYGGGGGASWDCNPGTSGNQVTGNMLITSGSVLTVYVGGGGGGGGVAGGGGGAGYYGGGGGGTSGNGNGGGGGSSAMVIGGTLYVAANGGAGNGCSNTLGGGSGGSGTSGGIGGVATGSGTAGSNGALNQGGTGGAHSGFGLPGNGGNGNSYGTAGTNSGSGDSGGGGAYGGGGGGGGGPSAGSGGNGGSPGGNGGSGTPLSSGGTGGDSGTGGAGNNGGGNGGNGGSATLSWAGANCPI